MKSPRRWIAWWTAGLFALAGSACGGAADEPASPWNGWTTLRLKARAAPLLRGQVELRLRRGPEGLRLETSTSARFIGATIAQSETVTLLDAGTGHTREYRSYSRKKGRRYTFGEAGYSVEKLRPAEQGEIDGWTVTSREEFPYPASCAIDGQPRPFDYYGMLLRLRELKLEASGDEVVLFVATSAGPQEYRIRVMESRVAQREFTNLGSGKKQTWPSREVRLRVAPTDPQAEAGFLDMQGDVEIWVEAQSKTLLEIIGKIPKVPGKVKLELSALG